jgi:Baseplate J-like protein
VWVRFEVSEAVTLPAYTQLVAEGGELPAQLPPEQLPAVLAAGALVFETLEAVSLLPDPPPLQLASVHGAVARLAAGSTSATVVGTSGGLNVGQLVLIGPVDPLASPAGQVVRLAGVTRQGPNTILQWGHADAVVADQALTQVAVQLRPGNLVLADQAQTHDWAALASPLAGRRYWPELPVPNPAYTAGLPAGGVVATPGASTRSAAPISSVLPSAAEMLAATGTPVQAAVELRAGSPDHWRSWIVRDSLLDSGPFDPGFVVEVEDGGGARLRFGDGTNGMQPPVGVNFQARVRSGGGSAGNVGIGAIAHLVGAEAAVQRVRNPVPAVGGADPEPLATVRLNAPTAFRITDRAVAPDDYSAAAREVDGVTDATTIIVPSGTGPLARVRIYAGDWKTPTAQLLEQVRDALARRRPAGVAVDVGGAVAAPVTIDLGITIEAGWALAAMATTVEQTLGARLTGPGCFGFATTLYRSEVITWLTALSGVLDVTLTRFRFTQDAPDAAARSELAPRFGHIIRIDDDPTAPELGSVSFRLRMEDS